MLVTFELPHYDIRVSPAFQADINAAKAALDARRAAQQQSAQRARRYWPKGRPPPPLRGGWGGTLSGAGARIRALGAQRHTTRS